MLHRASKRWRWTLEARLSTNSYAWCNFCFFKYFIIFLHPLSKQLLRPQRLNLCSGKHPSFHWCNIICVASSCVCVFDHCLGKKKSQRLYFPWRTSFSQPWVVENYPVQACVQWGGSLNLMMMIQQKDETLQVFTKYAQLVNNLPSFSTFQKTKVTVCTKRKTKQTGFLYVHVMCVVDKV